MHIEESLRVVFNTSPLIVLAKLNLLEKAIEVLGEVEIPKGVLEEIKVKEDQVQVKVIRLIKAGKICVEDVKRRFPRLGTGESSAIVLALMKRKIVVLDDRRARKIARELGLEVIGTLSILRRLYKVNVLKKKPNSLYKHLVRIGFYIDRKTFNKIFEGK